MIDAIEIKDFRGIRELKLEGLGRVNLFIGGNGCGKTTVAAACVMADNPTAWCFVAPFLADPRPVPRVPPDPFLIALRPGLDERRRPELVVHRAEASHTTSLRGTGGQLVLERDDSSFEIVKVTNWRETEPGKGAGVQWVPAFVESRESRANGLIGAYLQGWTAQVLDAVVQVNPEVQSIDVLGKDVFVRLKGRPLPMPIGILGDGALRVADFAIALGLNDGRVGIDELENGFHHSTLPKVIAMLRTAAPDRQIFATTHREELIVQACEQFVAENDDGLRVIRIDLRDGVHSAQVYTAEQALAGIDAGLEIRG